MILFQLSAAQGPLECCMAVVLATKALLKESEKLEVEVSVLEQVTIQPSSIPKSALGKAELLKSVLFKFEGREEVDLANRWQGTLQWICESQLRPKHRRKNWFITGEYFEPTSSKQVEDTTIKFESCRASGPGGQHVNKTNSAVRATHVESGMSVKVQTERSQHANKRLARMLIEHKLLEQSELEAATKKGDIRMQHHSIERGNASRVFKGIKFSEA